MVGVFTRTSFFCIKSQKKAVVSLLQKIAQQLVPENVIRKLAKQDFSLDANLLPASSVKIGFSAVSALKTLKTTVNATVQQRLII